MNTTIDTWIHVIELIMVVVLIPGGKKLVATLIELNQSVDLLTASMQSHRDAFNVHVTEDREHFKFSDSRLGDVEGNVREVMGILRASSLNRRNRGGGDQ